VLGIPPFIEKCADAQPPFVRALTGGQAGRVAATAKALRAYALVGTTVVVTERMAARLEGASLTYVSALNCMSAAERNAVRAGTLRLVDFVAKRWRQPDADALIAELGPDRILAALDRATAPAAAAGNGHIGGRS
jgi:hypothetical protein